MLTIFNCLTFEAFIFKRNISELFKFEIIQFIKIKRVISTNIKVYS